MTIKKIRVCDGKDRDGIKNIAVGWRWLPDGDRIREITLKLHKSVINPPIQASAFISWQEFKDYRHLCDQIGHIFMGLNTLQIFWISLTGILFSISQELSL